MSLTARILSELEEGHWTLKSIAPSFRRRLKAETNTQLQETSISEMCMGFYGKVSPQQIVIPNFKKELDVPRTSTDARELIEKTFVSDYPGSGLAAFETEISEKLQAALSLIKTKDVCLSLLLNELIAAFVRVKSVNFRSASHPQIFGLILIGDGASELTAKQLAVSVVHELAHQELFLINLLDRLVNQPFDYNEVHAPFQGTKRPPIGRLHSMWALYRMVQFQKIQNEVDYKYRELLVKNVEAFEDQELTPFGKKLVEIARKRAS